ncbi:hypothetical protein [Weissella cibaria]|uniref:Uncharacterized protein n=1 Tax=Weissella cibaria TaxID=137591 RepID=A0A9Q8JJX7_9LACO|nr:hypothetical protein [Weissella cibaria]QDG80859.1 hypothetical protein Wei3612_05500 [Weissella cibaria]QMU88980.1 hypothetical protein H3N00_02790 [Weissella cibaria]TVV28221.1 hypothetical protein FO435_10175 [Weissella cibaria]TVV36859.1 hypothetical protein FO439_10005 [Weissella cibaria]TVV41414.1 hypothetical protein FO438_10005 [Weissella cibaria]
MNEQDRLMTDTLKSDTGNFPLYTLEQVQHIVRVFTTIYNELSESFVSLYPYSDKAFARYVYEHVNERLSISTLQVKAVYRVKDGESIDRKQRIDGVVDDILGVRVLVDREKWTGLRDVDGEVKKVINDGMTEERYYFKAPVVGVPAWELQVTMLNSDLDDTTIKEFVHGHHDLMQLLANYDKK